MRALFTELLDLHLSGRKTKNFLTDSDEQFNYDKIYQAGLLNGKKEAWEAVHALISAKTETQGNAKIAETNGPVRASDTLFQLINNQRITRKLKSAMVRPGGSIFQMCNGLFTAIRRLCYLIFTLTSIRKNFKFLTLSNLTD